MWGKIEYCLEKLPLIVSQERLGATIRSSSGCKSVITTSTGGGRGGALLGIIIGSFPPGFSNPDLVSDQKILFSIPIFRPGPVV